MGAKLARDTGASALGQTANRIQLHRGQALLPQLTSLRGTPQKKADSLGRPQIMRT
ncbi:protein of unknown function [Pseudomonas mediterranea]